MSNKKTTTTNNTKTNTTKTVDTVALYNELIESCKTSTKYALVKTMNKFGIQCTTSPTTTPNLNDLYLQFNANKCGDLSRIHFTSKSIKVWCTDFSKSLFTDLIFDDVNDGSVRKYRATIAKTVENFTMVFDKFFNNGIIKMLPTNDAQ